MTKKSKVERTVERIVVMVVIVLVVVEILDLADGGKRDGYERDMEDDRGFASRMCWQSYHIVGP